MKTIANFKDRVFESQLSVKEAMGVFMVLLAVASVCVYALDPQSFLQ